MRKALVILFLAACGGGDISGGGDDGGGGDHSDLSGQDAHVALDSGPPADLAMGPPCGNGYCAAGELCTAAVCHKDCGKTARCGGPTSAMEVCCNAGDVCYLGACTTPGAACGGVVASPDGGAGDGGIVSSCSAAPTCPKGQYCETSLGHCLPMAPTVMCEYHPPTGSFAPVVKWEWQGSTTAPTYNQVMMAPMVADIDGNCMPDVVFITFAGGNYSGDGVLRAVRGDGKGELWSVTDPALRTIPGGQIALGDVDGDGQVEIFACHASKALIAFHSDGTKKWMSTDLPCGSYDAPSLADVNHDGKPEVIVGFNIYDANTGAVFSKPKTTIAATSYGTYGFYTTAAELDGDVTNGMEIVGGGTVFHSDGTLYWDHAAPNTGYAAIGDLDGDGLPDVVAVLPNLNQVIAYKHDGTVIWGPKDVNNGVATPSGPTGGGPPTIADFDGDGKPDVAAAGGYGYLVLKGQTGAVLWQNTQTTDTSSRVTGSSVFDFEGDGVAEAIYNDEHNLRVYSGPTGKVELKLCSTSGTLWENPVIVDVDGDDHAEIVVMDNNYAIGTCDADVGGGKSHTGFKVIGDMQNRWVRTRRIWNQHTYHVTNVGDDATIPKSELTNWTQMGLNDFRQNVQTSNVLAAPDLLPRDIGATFEACPGALVLGVTVVNQGAAGVPAGIPVTFYYNDMTGKPAVAGTVMTSGQILPGATETVTLKWMPPGMDAHGPFTIWAVVNDDGTGMPLAGIHECNVMNNTSAMVIVGCPQIG